MKQPSWKVARDVMKSSLAKFDPRYVAKNPVIFILYLCFAVMLLMTLFPAAFADIAGSTLSWPDYAAIAVILFLTMWFSFAAEAIAEVQGRAQADSLRRMKAQTMARRIMPDGSFATIGSNQLKPGDLVEVRQGDAVPGDGGIESGALMLDESMMTGESQLVLRESGGDKTSVLGGTRVVSGNARVKITAGPGHTFLDRMISLVEGAERKKTPVEISLTVVLVSLSIALLIVVATIVLLARYYGIPADVGSLIAMLVCLMPTTIGGLLPAIGIAGINRVTRINVVARSGRAVEAAGDVDELILDKTGTLTIGNRYASQFMPAPGRSMDDVATVAMLSSAGDDTPEGKSIVRLGEKLGYTLDRSRLEGSTTILFTPETRVSGVVLKKGEKLVKGSMAAIGGQYRTPDSLKLLADNVSRGGATPLAVARGEEVIGMIVLRDLVKPGIRDRIEELRRMGIRTVMCTGDNRLTAAAIARETGVDDFYADAVPEDKLAIIRRDQAAGKLVAMTGDGTNDAPALAQADVGLAMNSGTAAAKEAANMVDLDSDPTKLIEVVTIGKQLLITRGALTTFSVTNDVAKYFAILPAILAPSIPAVSALNIMRLASPKTAIFATLIFNMLAIPLLIPVAISGVKYRPMGATEMLKRNLLVYGLGGLLSSFVAIKLIDVLLSGGRVL